MDIHRHACSLQMAIQRREHAFDAYISALTTPFYTELDVACVARRRNRRCTVQSVSHQRRPLVLLSIVPSRRLRRRSAVSSSKLPGYSRGWTTI